VTGWAHKRLFGHHGMEMVYRKRVISEVILLAILLIPPKLSTTRVPITRLYPSMSAPVLSGHPVLPSDPLKLDHVPLWDIYRQLGINYGDRLFARSMDADNEDVPLENITWRKLLIDAMKVAGALKENLNVEGEKVTYALLADSSYTYFVNIVAGWLNHWTVISVFLDLLHHHFLMD
jgi:hypothetical protein